MSSHTLRLILPGNDTKTVFLGVPLNTQSAISLTANLVMFIKDYKYYIHIGKEFSASNVSLTHTAFYANPFYPTLVDELRLRGLAVTFGHLLHGHGHSHSGSGNERSRQPHFHVHIDHAKTSTMVSRHNMHYKSMHIPHLIDFQYVYEDTGEPLLDAHARAIGQVVLTLTFEGFTV